MTTTRNCIKLEDWSLITIWIKNEFELKNEELIVIGQNRMQGINRCQQSNNYPENRGK